MKKIFFALLLSLSIIGCSGNTEELSNIKPALVKGATLSSLKLNDQFGKAHSLPSDTKLVIFAFSKDMAHTCNDFFATKQPNYLETHHALFVADVSAAPSLIRSMFIMPGLKDLKHTVLLFEDKTKAAPFRAKVDTEKITIVTLENGTITKTTSLTTDKELQKAIEL